VRQVASGDEGAPWTAWLNLPVISAAALTTGVVKLETCPECGGYVTEILDIIKLGGMEYDPKKDSFTNGHVAFSAERYRETIRRLL